MTDALTRRILAHVTDRRYQPRAIEDLAGELNVSAGELDEFGRSVQRLIDEGQVVLGSANTVVLPPPGRQMTGVFRLNERGFGFLVPDSPTEHGDLFVPAGSTNDALTGDRVRARVIRQEARAGAGRSPYVGKIVEILQRADRKYVGNLAKRGSHWIVEADSRALAEPIVIRDPHAKDAKAGDKVVVELIEFPSEGRLAQGVITEVLGESGEPSVETVSVMRAYNIREDFPADVPAEARRVAQTFSENAVPPDREDLTGTFICTIDPPDARDFDDAISITRLDPQRSGGAAWELGVHIADVSHFVCPDSALDKEAHQRGNSVYLPRKVVPMLPEVLSNGVCSLQEGVNRFTKTAFMRFDAAGKVLGQRFSRSVIRSAKRLTYLEAQALIDGDLREARKHARTDTKYPKELFGTLALMDELARTIRQRRLDDGMIVLGLPEVELVFNDAGHVVDAVPEDDAFTHTIIEMFMVEANEAAARLFDLLDVPMVRRIHADPPSHDMAELRQFARVAGYNIPAHPTRRELQTLLDAVRGKPQQHAVHLAVLRTLSKAEYAPLLIGHFALASEHYTHFTSPIRRYPDLLVHRGLDAFFDAFPQSAQGKMPHDGERSRVAQAMRERLHDEAKLQQISSHCSLTERNAEAAERDLRNYLVLDLLSDHLGDDYDGTVTGVTASGIFVQIDRFLVDGFIRVSDLPSSPGDRWRLNRSTGALVAQRSGKVIQIGDRFVVRIANVNPTGRKLDLVILEAKTAGGEKKPHREQPAGAKAAHQKTMKLKQSSPKKTGGFREKKNSRRKKKW